MLSPLHLWGGTSICTLGFPWSHPHGQSVVIGRGLKCELYPFGLLYQRQPSLSIFYLFRLNESHYDSIGNHNPTIEHPMIEKKESRLQFVSDGEVDRIEEGLSIQLPAKGGSDMEVVVR